MMTFPLPDGALLIVIEPSNIQQMKEGHPLKVGEHGLCFTPDMQAFASKLGAPLAQSGQRIEVAIHITAEQLDAALKACQYLPEVMR